MGQCASWRQERCWVAVGRVPEPLSWASACRPIWAVKSKTVMVCEKLMERSEAGRFLCAKYEK